MTIDERFLGVGLYINGALYLSGCFVAGIVSKNTASWKCALAGFAACYLAYFCQLTRAPRWVSVLFVAGSILAGAAAGLNLI